MRQEGEAVKSDRRSERVKTWSLTYTKRQFFVAEKFLIDGSAEEKEIAARFFDILDSNARGIPRSEYQEFQELKMKLTKPSAK